MNIISSLALIAGIFALALPVAANAATHAQLLRPPAASYTYGGYVYDRLFSAATRPRYERTIRKAVPNSRLRNLATAPYSITDLIPIAGIANREGALDGYGYPTAVNDSGLITYYDQCECTGNNDNIALLFNDTATYTAILYADQNQEGLSNAIPYAINASGDSAGEVTNVGPNSIHENVIDFSSTGGILYGSGASDKTYALGLNDANTSVGHDTGAKGSFAAMFFAGAGRVLLAPPKNVSWIGTATGINRSGDIVGYGTFATGGRALRFFTNKPAVVIPVGAAGVSTSAQAINVHGDIVGNAGSQAFLYHANRVTYLPTPSGDAPGNAVAYAINASGEVVGDINAPSGGTSTAFLYSNGQSYDLTALLPANSGWQIVDAVGINATGQIVGMGYYTGEGGFLTPFSMKLTAASASRR